LADQQIQTSGALTAPSNEYEARKGAETMAETPPIPIAPRGLKTAGKALWKSVHAVFDFEEEPHLLAVLEEACRVRDVIVKLDAAMKDEPMTVLGSARQLTIHPLISQAGAERSRLASLLKSIGLPDNGDPDDPKARRSAAGRTAARARWNGS
jgi:hypothetical protein